MVIWAEQKKRLTIHTIACDNQDKDRWSSFLIGNSEGTSHWFCCSAVPRMLQGTLQARCFPETMSIM